MSLTTRPKRTSVHKKRNALHHRHSKHYLKTYWPYLPIGLIVGAGMMFNSLLASQTFVLGASSDFSTNSLLNYTNNSRTKNNEQPLTLNQQLTNAAQAKANDMAANNYWAHNSPDGKTPWSFITAAGYQYQSAGENLAYGFSGASQTVAGWMNSPEHRANILDASYQNVGFGVAQSPNYQGRGPETIIVAEYGQPLSRSTQISFSVPNQPAASQTALNGDLGAHNISRIQTLTGGNAAWASLALTIGSLMLLVWMVGRHGNRFRKVLTQGENFIIKHPLLDILATLIITAGFILTRSSGIIR